MGPVSTQPWEQRAWVRVGVLTVWARVRPSVPALVWGFQLSAQPAEEQALARALPPEPWAPLWVRVSPLAQASASFSAQSAAFRSWVRMPWAQRGEPA